MALYLTTGPHVRVVTKDVARELNCTVALWPRAYQLSKVRGSNGKIYKYDIYVDDEGLWKQSPYNEIATYLAHPYNILRGRLITGDAIVVACDEKTNYTLEDFAAIKDGVWINDDESNVDLVEANLGGTQKKQNDASTDDDAVVTALAVDLERLRLSIATPRAKGGYTVEELKLLAKERGLALGGQKAVLAQRIADALKVDSAPTETTTTTVPNPETTLCNVRVAKLRPHYRDLKEWCADENNVYIARGGIVWVLTEDGGKERYPKEDSLWANPYKVKEAAEGEDVIARYETYIRARLESGDIPLTALAALKGKNLGCWCAPQRCHGEVLLKLLEEYEL